MASIITSDTLKTAKSLLSAKSIRAGAKGEREADYFMAERLLEKARERVAKGTREAKEIARQGRMLESDALAAMGGMGMALICMQEGINNEFIFDENAVHDIKIIKGHNCPNECDITIMYKEDKKIGSTGNRCGRCVAEY